MGGIANLGGLQGLIKTVLGLGGPPAAPGGGSDVFRQIFGAGGSPTTPEQPADNGAWNEDWGGGKTAEPLPMPPETAPRGAFDEAIPGLPTGTTPTNVISGASPLPAVLNQPYPVKKRTPLDYLLMAASPVVSGLVQSMLVRRHRGRAFAAGALQTGFGEAASELERPERIRELQRQRDIENILLQQKVRGTPQGGINTQTGQPEFRYPGTNEVATPGFGPQPRVPRVPKIVTQRDEQGNETPYEVNDKGQATPVTVQQGGVQVPLVSKPKPEKPEKPLRELRKGNMVPNSKKHNPLDPEQYYWLEQGKEPVASGLMVGESDKPVKDREGDIARAERKQINDASMQFLQEAHARLGAGKKPEEYANAASDLFDEAAKTSKPLRQYSNQISTVIRNTGRRVKSENELMQMLGLLLGGQGSGTPSATTPSLQQ